MSKYGDENKMIMITPESLMTQYAERMACFFLLLQGNVWRWQRNSEKITGMKLIVI